MIPILNDFKYVRLQRNTADDGMRFYTCPETGAFLPSVTTILGHTKDKTFLIEWKKRIGEKEADRIRDEAGKIGTLMHTHLENHIQGKPRPGGNNKIRVLAAGLADTIIEKGLCKVSEAWGFEVPLYFPGMYAGTTDLVGIHEGSPAIMDYKNSRKIKTKEQIEDYFCQCAAYALAHNYAFGTNVAKVVIFMVDRERNFKEFVIQGNEFFKYCDIWMKRIDQYAATGGALQFNPGANVNVTWVEPNTSE